MIAFEEPGRLIEGVSYTNGPAAVRWSPDGSRIGFLHTNFKYYAQARGVEAPSLQGSWRIGVAGADGSGAKTVFASAHTDATNASEHPSLNMFDWR